MFQIVEKFQNWSKLTWYMLTIKSRQTYPWPFKTVDKHASLPTWSICWPSRYEEGKKENSRLCSSEMHLYLAKHMQFFHFNRDFVLTPNVNKPLKRLASKASMVVKVVQIIAHPSTVLPIWLAWSWIWHELYGVVDYQWQHLPSFIY